jgi:hypothetical protein
MSCGIVITSAVVLVEHEKVLLKKYSSAGHLGFHSEMVDDYSQTLIQHTSETYSKNLGLRICIVHPIPYVVYTAKEEPGNSLDIFMVHFNATRLEECPLLEHPTLEWIDLNSLSQKNLLMDVLPTLKHFGYIP